MKNNRILKRLVLITLFTVMVLLIKGGVVKAANASISCPGSVEAGNMVKIVVTGSAAQWNLSLKVNGSQIASSNELDSVENKTIVFSGKYTPSSSGTLNVTLEGTATDSDGSTVRNFGSKSIQVTSSSSSNAGAATSTAPENTSSDSSSTTEPRLTNLGIRPHDFSGFRSANTSYSVNVPNDCTSIEVYASGNGSISGTGTKTLKEGTNRFDVTVSLNGSTKTYTVSVNRATASGEDVPNNGETENGEEEKPEEGSDEYYLENLSVDGFELSPKFDKKVMNYTVKLNKKPESLEKLKELVKPIYNNEKYKMEVITGDKLEEDKNIVTIVIKDDEKEYSRYTVTFVCEEKNEVKASSKVTTYSPEKKKTYNILGFEFDEDMIPIFVVVGCAFLSIAIAILLAIVAFVKSKKLRRYEEEDEVYNDFENENDEDEKTDSEDKEKSEDESDGDEDKDDDEPRRNRRPGFRGLKRRGNGRHY